MEFLTRVMTFAFAGLMLVEKYLDWRDERSDKAELREALQDERAHSKDLEASKMELFEAYTGAVEQYMAMTATTKSIDNAAKVQYLEAELQKAEGQRDQARMAASETLNQNLDLQKYIRDLAGPNETEEEQEGPVIMRDHSGNLLINYPASWVPVEDYVHEVFEANEFLEEEDEVE